MLKSQQEFAGVKQQEEREKALSEEAKMIESDKQRVILH